MIYSPFNSVDLATLSREKYVSSYDVQLIKKFCGCTEQKIGVTNERIDVPHVHGHQLNDRDFHATRYDAHRIDHSAHRYELRARHKDVLSCRNKRQDPKA